MALSDKIKKIRLEDRDDSRDEEEEKNVAALDALSDSKLMEMLCEKKRKATGLTPHA